MRCADDRRARLVRELREKCADRERGGRIEARGRLVGDDDGRSGGEDPRERDALALSGGEEIDTAIRVRRETDRRQGLRRALRRLAGSDASQARGRARRSPRPRESRRGQEPARSRRRARAGAPRAARGRARKRPCRRAGSLPRRGDRDLRATPAASTCPSRTARPRPRAGLEERWHRDPRAPSRFRSAESPRAPRAFRLARPRPATRGTVARSTRPSTGCSETEPSATTIRARSWIPAARSVSSGTRNQPPAPTTAVSSSPERSSLTRPSRM